MYCFEVHDLLLKVVCIQVVRSIDAPVQLLVAWLPHQRWFKLLCRVV